MNNQKGQGQCGQGKHKGKGCQGMRSGQGNGCGRGRCETGQQGNGRGKKRELFEQKYSEYIKTVEIPEFDSQEQYSEWLLNTEEGKKHASEINRINAEIDAECPWGGRRENAGRKQECIRKIPYSRRINSDVLEVLKTYAKEQNLTETQALEKAILNLKTQ